MGLLRDTDGLQGASEPLVADISGCRGYHFFSLALEKGRLDARPNPATTADLVSESVAPLLEANEENRHWIDGLSEEERTEAQWTAQCGLLDEGRHTFPTRSACFEFMGKLTSFGTFSSLAGFIRLMGATGAGVNVLARADKGYRLHRD